MGYRLSLCVGSTNFVCKCYNLLCRVDTLEANLTIPQSFGVAQLLFSFLPLLAFITFAISTIVFALGVAVVFSLFWIGVALLALVPALLVTSCIGVLAWAWAVGSFVVARWIYTRLPVGVQSDTQVKVGSKQLNVVKDQNGINAKVEHN